ncbi:MAG: hypothetical protein A4E72_01747 [Syntrophus sp. PtaU1.Bin208]|nr:MAG: hypothetical protein A4E72_01747 [Syntrophus sp. PtaU1.Bin208]
MQASREWPMTLFFLAISMTLEISLFKLIILAHVTARLESMEAASTSGNWARWTLSALPS